MNDRQQLAAMGERIKELSADRTMEVFERMSPHQMAVELAEAQAKLQDATRQCVVMAELLRNTHEYIFGLEDQPRRDFDRGCEILDDIDALLAGQVPDHIADANKMVPEGWIKCSERIPEESTDADGGATGYLVLYEEGKEPSGGFNVGVWNVTYLRRWWAGFITHWMPLPAAPKPQGGGV